MGLIANQMLMEAVGKIVSALKEKRANKKEQEQETTGKHESKKNRDPV